ncbi:uncharacterized protein Eint_070935 [Encephalitozoon intestinalis ATCC 50506]|uniref:Uncharacterized protein n=1 Tax=Encephalitozoon intestinalis (strain ATCC 50506) TaxID=876142 RepID=W8P915_ENCIT|nr:uncharacterized protein Eint_070935 [Encephalitozoon intestinalis ATCC 50506]AHL30128.1 hypothetical protein Eint_070935 [Encephalitozoon intestinalis ATCC 50506]UTX45610.1 hypothetical protein GPK93_07g11750 [Encephalitozoon intestinalis]
MDAEALLRNEENKSFLMKRLEDLIEKHGFDRRIDEFVENLVGAKMADVIDINKVFDKLYDFVIMNLPPEIQETFYHDVRSFIERSVVTEDQ